MHSTNTTLQIRQAQNTIYEIPTLKKVLDQSDKQVRDLKKKLGDHQVGAANSRAKFLQACKELDIDGGDGDGDVDEEMLRERLRTTAVGVGPLLEMVATCLMHPTIASACDSYQAFLDYTLAQHCTNGGTAIAETPGRTSRPIAATLRQLLSEAEGGAFAMAERLEDASMRQGLMTDLLELEAFLKQRIVDRKAQGAMVQVLSSAPSSVLAHDQKVESYLEKVQVFPQPSITFNLWHFTPLACLRACLKPKTFLDRQPYRRSARSAYNSCSWCAKASPT
jgi:hypothetical protein